MEREEEVKILEVNKDSLVEKIKHMGGILTFNGDIRSIRFDKQNSLRKTGKRLRLRQKGDIVEVTVKTDLQKNGTKGCYEHNLIAQDIDDAKDLFLALGYTVYRDGVKHRESYSIGSTVAFDFDTHPDLPTYLEIEAAKPEMVKRYVKKLGFSKKDMHVWTEGEVLDYYAKLARKG